MLLSLDMDQLAGDGSDVNAALIKTMEAQTKQLSSTIAGELQRTKLEHARLKAVAEGLPEASSAVGFHSLKFRMSGWSLSKRNWLPERSWPARAT